MKIIIFDFEVFKYDTLFGGIVLDNDKEEVVQTWDLDKFKDFYYSHKQIKEALQVPPRRLLSLTSLTQILRRCAYRHIFPTPQSRLSF